ncbi:MAG: hypothetical protein KAS15_05290, partial [Nanoarchaeota archaeon]|nr:hypothetical protein [Nanoarchaeota archaeon]
EMTLNFSFLAAGRKKRKLEKLYENIQQNKADLIKAAEGLDAQHRKGKISKEVYNLRCDAVIGTRSKKDWIKHYDSYAKECREKIDELNIEFKGLGSVRRIYQAYPFIPYILFAMVIIGMAFFLVKPAFIGLVVYEESVNASDEVHVLFNESGTYTWTLSRPGELRSIMMSGRVSADGFAVVSIIHDNVSYVILNSSQLEGGGFGLITGYATFEGMEEEVDEIAVTEPVVVGESDIPEDIILDIAMEYKSGTSFDPEDDGWESTGGFIDFTVENTITDQNESHLCTIWKINKAYKECYGSGLCCDFVEVERYDSDWKKPFMAYYGLEAVALDNNVSAQIWSVDYNLSLDDPYSNIYRSEAMQLPAVFYYRGYLFEDACTDTCLVAGLGFNATNYTLQIDIGNAELEIGAIDYIVSVKDFIVNETLVQHDAEIGKPVRWTKTNTYDLAKPGHSMNISINAENITVFKKKGTKMVAVGDLDAEIRSEGIVKTIREHNLEKQIENLQKIIEKEARPQEKDNLKDRLDNLAAELKQVASAIESDFISIDIAEIVVPSETDTIEIEYYTPAPETIETNISPTSKQVVVTSEEHYTDILTYASLPSEAEPESVHLYWIVNGTRNEVFDITKKDTNDNGLVDWIEWVTPHLSNQTYVIEITGEGLYNWSAGMFYNTTTDWENVTLLNDSADTYYTSGHYISQTFDAGNETRWMNINWGESVIPYSQVVLLEDGFEDISWDAKWQDNGVTDWSNSTDLQASGSYSAENIGTNNDNDMISNDINTSIASDIRVFFWYNKDKLEDGDFSIQIYDGSSYNHWHDLDVYNGPDFCAGNGGDGTWCRFNEVITDSQYFRDNFRLKFEGTETDLNERVAIDDVNITYARETNIAVKTRTSNDNTIWTAWSSNHTNPSGLINASA